jgi:hypothetical protein
MRNRKGKGSDKLCFLWNKKTNQILTCDTVNRSNHDHLDLGYDAG